MSCLDAACGAGRTTTSGAAQGWAGEERQFAGQEKAEVGQELAMAHRATAALGGESGQPSTVAGKLQEIDEKSQAGTEVTESLPEALPYKQVTKERGARLEEAHP